MRRTLPCTLAALVALVCVGPAPGAAQEADATHGPSTFTGQVKPVLYVTDVEESAPFYRDALGFELLSYADGADGEPYYAEMSAGGLKFGLHDPLNDEHATWVGHQRLYFRVTDVRGHRQALSDAGASPGELVETDWMDMFIVRDPDGHQIVFAETDPEVHGVDPW